MAEWEIVDEGEIILDGPIDWVDAKIASGALSVAVTDGPARVVVGGVSGGPIVVSEDGSGLRIRHERPTHDEWPHRHDYDNAGRIVESVLGSIRDMIGMIGVGRSAEVSVLLPVPAIVRARTASADLLVSGTRDATLTAASGSITASHIAGAINIKTASGDIACANVTGRLYANTASGEVAVTRAVLDELRANSVSGDILVDADLGAGEHSMRSVSSDLLLRVDPGDGIDIDASTVSGNLACAFGTPMQDQWPGGKRRLRVQTGNAATHLICHTVSGDLTVVGRAA
jgi:DUF4097 and DUF4098 domain-containing protein YvlB